MTPEQKASLVEKLLPVVVGALLAAIPALTVSTMQARAAVRQLVLDRQFTVLKDYSIACSRRVELAKRLLFLVDVRASLKSDASKELTERLLAQHEAINRDVEDSRLALISSTVLANAVFAVELTAPQEPEPASLDTSTTDMKRVVDALRGAVPMGAAQCAKNAALLAGKLEK